MKMRDSARLHPLLNPGESITEALERQAAEIERLQDAKRAALKIADERSKENVELRKRMDKFEAGNEQLRAEIYEQARLNGIGAERELALRAELVRLRADKEAEIVRLRTDQAVWVKETLRAHQELEAENERLQAALTAVAAEALRQMPPEERSFRAKTDPNKNVSGDK